MGKIEHMQRVFFVFKNEGEILKENCFCLLQIASKQILMKKTNEKYLNCRPVVCDFELALFSVCFFC